MSFSHYVRTVVRALTGLAVAATAALVATPAGADTPNVKTVQAIQGEATFYSPGLGQCGVSSADTDLVVAVGTEQFGNRAACGRQITVAYGDKTVTATVVDVAPDAGPTGIDLSPAAFEALAPLNVQHIPVTWDFS